MQTFWNGRKMTVLVNSCADITSYKFVIYIIDILQLRVDSPKMMLTFLRVIRDRKYQQPTSFEIPKVAYFINGNYFQPATCC